MSAVSEGLVITYSKTRYPTLIWLLLKWEKPNETSSNLEDRSGCAEKLTWRHNVFSDPEKRHKLESPMDRVPGSLVVCMYYVHRVPRLYDLRVSAAIPRLVYQITDQKLLNQIVQNATFMCCWWVHSEFRCKSRCLLAHVPESTRGSQRVGSLREHHTIRFSTVRVVKDLFCTFRWGCCWRNR